ncbi:MAG: phosphoribosylformylglycinamidine synthase II, partial [Candidatus Omnitrophica bacterium]|nr:phosphoribosylformylglycinamidine synthase II [Candidatus Omnitrophota bacterium]
LGGSQYLLIEHGLRAGIPPRLDLKREGTLQNLILDSAKNRILNSCHDLSEGGFAVALAECLLGKVGHPLGADVNWPGTRPIGNSLRQDTLLFGESQSRVLVSLSPAKAHDLESQAKRHGVPYFKIGQVTKSGLQIESLINLSSEQIEKAYREAIPRRMN